jgi:hypothetical protein
MEIDNINHSKCYFVTFGSGNQWRPAIKRIRRQAASSRRFGKVFAFSEKDLGFIYKDISQDFFSINQRGYGLWIWKPYIILNVLKAHPDCEVLLYLDAGCEINSNSISLKILDEYIDIAKSGNGLGFELPFLERNWTSKYVIEYMSAQKFSYSKQLAGGIFFLKNNLESHNFLNDWINNMLLENNTLLLGNKSRVEENPDFMEHRFDQSIFSILWKKNEFNITQDKSYWAPNWSGGNAYPIWSTRSKLRFSFSTNKLILLVYRIFRFLIITGSRGKIAV